MCCIRDPHRREIPGAVGSSQLLSVSTIGFDAVSRLYGDEVRRNHLAFHSQFAELPIQHVSGGACLVWRQLDLPVVVAGRSARWDADDN